MKELEIKKSDTNIEINIQQKKKVEHELIGKIVPHEGHKVWEINKETLEIKEAKFTNTTYKAFGENQKEILTKQGYAYVSALNKRTALDNYKKGKSGGKKLGTDEMPFYNKKKIL